MRSEKVDWTLVNDGWLYTDFMLVNDTQYSEIPAFLRLRRDEGSQTIYVRTSEIDYFWLPTQALNESRNADEEDCEVVAEDDATTLKESTATKAQARKQAKTIGANAPADASKH